MSLLSQPRNNLAVILFLGFFTIISFLLYISLDSNVKRSRYFTPNDGLEVEAVGKRVDSVRRVIDGNREMITRLRARFQGFRELSQEVNRKTNESIARAQSEGQNIHLDCPAGGDLLAHNASGDIQMLSLYDIVPFDNLDGGVWKQGWPIDYDPEKIRDEKRLEVIVIPHSHNDPGWLKTFESYFEDQTKQILDLTAIHLTDKPDLKFIYAEMSFFELWWSLQTSQVRDRVKSLLKNGQFEIVTGGWVMTDEANSHFFSTVMELFEGHEFLSNQLDYIPKNHWSIDPFGLSPTLAYILNRANLSNMAVQRVHYSVKKYLAQNKQLEFVWRQLFSGSSKKTDIITHMFPFFSYDAPHSCGPDPKVCCQFDFRRNNAFGACPWGKNPEQITGNNVAERAEILADQYRKKAQLYKFNTILVPLGDDFRYDVGSEWTDQYSNYKVLFDYMNAKEDWNIHARFGTLADYFAILKQRMDEEQNEAEKILEEARLRHNMGMARGRRADPLPILTGDFFTYADRDDHYWSGYFTSRPFYKHMDRSLQHYLRSADVFFSLANWHLHSGSLEIASLYDKLVRARRFMSLFQHHDGVTGTARTHVMVDYGEKMVQALTDSKLIIARCVESLLNSSKLLVSKTLFQVDEKHFVNHLSEKLVVKEDSIIVVVNSLGQPRQEVICVHVGGVNYKVSQPGRTEIIPQQIGPIIYVNMEGNLVPLHDKFELCFLAFLPALGFERFAITESEEILANKVKITSSSNLFEFRDFEVYVVGNQDKRLTLANEQITASFDAGTGFLKSVKRLSFVQVDVELSFVRYGSRKRNPTRNGGSDSLSGAYLFLPDGPASPLILDANSFVLIQGPIRQYILVKGPLEVGLVHRATIDIDSNFVYLVNNVNLAIENGIDRGNRANNENGHLGNYELAMRLKVPAIKEDSFYTDLNGFQMIRRRRQAKLPLQAQFYPMPGAAYIEDSITRVSLLGRQALGVASLESGEMQVMLDRRLLQDDDRGLGQPVDDNRLTESQFRLFVENFTPNQRNMESDTVGFHSLAVNIASAQLHYPPILLVGRLDPAKITEFPNSFTGLRRPFPCDIQPVAFRTLSNSTIYKKSERKYSNEKDYFTGSSAPKNEAALVLLRHGVECALNTPISSVSCSLNDSLDGNVGLDRLFAIPPRSFQRGSLTLLYTDGEEKQSLPLFLEPMELATIKVNY